MMKQLITLLALSVFLASCAGMGASTGLTEEQEAAIPSGANLVVVHSTQSPDELYQAVREAVIADGYSLSEENENASLRRFVTDDRNVGRRLRMHLVVRVVPESRQALAEISGKWSFEQTSNAMESTMGGTQRVQEATRDAAWTDVSASRYAYARLVLLAGNLPADEVDYVAR